MDHLCGTWQAEADIELKLSASPSTAVGQSNLTLTNLGYNTILSGVSGKVSGVTQICWQPFQLPPFKQISSFYLFVVTIFAEWPGAFFTDEAFGVPRPVQGGHALVKDGAVASSTPRRKLGVVAQLTISPATRKTWDELVIKI